MKNPMNVISTPIPFTGKVLKTFDLLSQILPSKEVFPNNRHYNTNVLDYNSIEFKVIGNLFMNTWKIG